MNPAELARLFYSTSLERLSSDKHSDLFGMFISYEENKVL
jgi:hypothetical protein